MNRLLLVRRGLIYHRRTHVGVLAGVTVAVTVLVGALLVGDSVRYTLRTNALLRLGDTAMAVNTRNRFVSEALAERIGSSLDARVAPVLDLPGMAIGANSPGDGVHQVNRVRVLGVDEHFWSLCAGPPVRLGPGETALSRGLAVALSVRDGDEISLRIRKPARLPTDAPLSSRAEDATLRRTFRVRAVVPDSRLGRFSLSSSQAAPHNAFLDLHSLQELVDLESRVNIVLLGQTPAGGPAPENAAAALRQAWRLEDAGASLNVRTELGVVDLSGESVFLPDGLTKKALSLDGAVGTLAYLANAIELHSNGTARTVPYSFVLAASRSADRGLSVVPDHMRDDQVVLNEWLAVQLGAAPGSKVTVRYFELLASNAFVVRSRQFEVLKVIGMDRAEKEGALMPEFPGLSDVERCGDWDIGMPLEEDLLSDRANEDYWNRYRDTPKAFVTLEAGTEMWGNRFGRVTGIRYRGGQDRADALQAMFERSVDAADLGLRFESVRLLALESVSESLDFGQLFLGMSFFLIAAALGLTGALVVLGVQQRSAETGTLLALGYGRMYLYMLYFLEFGLVAAAGSAAGAVMGTFYTRFLLWGLSRQWSGAVAGNVVAYHAEAATVVSGGIAGFVCAILAMALVLRTQAKRTAHDLLSSDIEAPAAGFGMRQQRWAAAVSVACLAAAVTVVAWTVGSRAHSPSGPFFAAGALLMASGIAGGRWLMCRHFVLRTEAHSRHLRLSEWGLRLRNTCRRPGRSLATMGVLACGCFLVFSVSSMEQNVRAGAGERYSGTGGFDLFGECDVALPEDIGSPDGRRKLGLHADRRLAGTDFVCLRMRGGDDASCLNLSRAQQPTLLGVDPDTMSNMGAFVSSAGEPVWEQLKADLGPDTIPALVGDRNTAAWGLQQRTGTDKGGALEYTDERGRSFRVKLVGALPMSLSIFQGSILIANRDFSQRFPSEAGFRVVLSDVPEGKAGGAAAALTSRLSRYGFAVRRTADRLADFYTVERTYLRVFLALGSLGLVLGSAGMGIAVMRNVLERRSELALLKAVGFGRGRIRALVLGEHVLLLAAGAGWGAASACLAIAPSLVERSSPLPYGIVVLVLLGILAGGVLWTALATFAATRGPLLPSLRCE